MEDAGGAERLQVKTPPLRLPYAQRARGGLPSRRHALVSNLRHTKDPLAWRGSLTEGSLIAPGSARSRLRRLKSQKTAGRNG